MLLLRKTVINRRRNTEEILIHPNTTAVLIDVHLTGNDIHGPFIIEPQQEPELNNDEVLDEESIVDMVPDTHSGKSMEIKYNETQSKQEIQANSNQ